MAAPHLMAAGAGERPAVTHFACLLLIDAVLDATMRIDKVGRVIGRNQAHRLVVTFVAAIWNVDLRVAGDAFGHPGKIRFRRGL